MSLIKRSVILHKDSTKGVLTIIRIGETLGAKLVLNEPIKKTLWVGLSLGDETQQNYKITAQVSELTPNCALGFNDSIGVVLLDEDGMIFAYGGVKEKVSINLIKEAQKQDLLSTNEVSNTQTTLNESEDSSLQNATEDTQNVASVIAEQSTAATATETAAPYAEQDMPIATNQPDVSNKEDIQPVESAKQDQPTVSDNNPTNINSDKRQSSTAAGATQSTFSTGDIKEKKSPDKSSTQPQWIPTEEKKAANNPFNIPKAKNFYQAVRSRLEEIMTINPKESDLESIIPDSDWVKVRYSGDEYYVVGRLYENNTVTYIGYGVPGIENVRPPKEAEELCDFLPLPDKQGVGYWLMFQKAEDGTMSRDI